MFEKCTSLKTLPKNMLPAKSLNGASCYTNMFKGCTGLTSIPEGFLPATFIANYSYSNMFSECSNLL